MSWHARLDLNYSRQGDSTQLQFQHEGPLRIMRSLYPEGPSICHNVIVHPPGGLVEGDVLAVTVNVDSDAHALLSTPGATRFYGNPNEQISQQQVHISVAADGRLEWLPLESIAYPQCWAENTLDMDLASGASAMAWDVTAFGLLQAGKPFDSGRFRQRMRVNGVWLESGLIDGQDDLLMNSPLGLNGQRSMGTLFWAAGHAVDETTQAEWVESVRAVLPTTNTLLAAGATWPNDQVLVVRVLGPMAEPVMAVLQSAWAVLRRLAWQLPSTPPRIWRV
jgi:urease accessory protein